MVGLGFLLLVFAFRGLLIPAATAVLNLLAAASFGALTAFFEWGWGTRAFGLGRAGPIEAYMPEMVLAILFGLSMDYQVFLVSRMAEEWSHTRDNARSVLVGQKETARVIIAAAAIMIAVFIAFVFMGQRSVAEFGIGLAAALALDAFVLRAVLVPAVMYRCGRANWWLPRWLDRRLPHLAIKPSADEPPAGVPEPARAQPPRNGLQRLSDGMTGENVMAEHMPGDPDARDGFVWLDDGDIHVVRDGAPGAPAVLLIHGTAASTAWWDPVIPPLAAACRVIRIDLAGHGRSASPADGYDIPAQARRVGAVLDWLGASRVTVIGHSTGGTVATALAEQRPGLVTALALISIGPSLDAVAAQSVLGRLLLAPLPGRLLWALRTEAMIRKAMRTAFTRPVDVPDAIIKATLGMTHRALSGTSRASDDYLRQQSLPDRLAVLGLPVLVIFGTDDLRWRPSASAAYHAVPGARVEMLRGIGHTPMMEDPQVTGKLLLDFVAAVARHPDGGRVADG
jgi:pimeloyl-ACP methyl ester carboxylesterase